MRKYTQGLLALMSVVLILAACQSETKDEPTELDVARRQTETVQAQPTNTPWPTPWPTDTPTIRQSPVPSRTPVPTPDPDTSTEEPFDNYVVPGDWFYETFTDSSGDTYTFEDFVGRGVIFQPMTSTCEMCTEQQRLLMDAIQDRHDSGLLGDMVFIALDVNPDEPVTLLSDVLQRGLADQWRTVELLRGDDVPADYLVASASEDLVAALERDFRPDVTIPETLTMIVIDSDGLAHLLPEGMVDFRDLRTAIQIYGNPPPPPED